MKLVKIMLVVALGVMFAQWCVGGGGKGFDKLSAEDRKVLAERFERDIWPLMTRGGKDGCVGCHRTGKIVSALRMSGNVDKDFAMMLRDGFFLYGDAGSLLARVTEKDPKRMMPPPEKKEHRWSEKEIQVLREFFVDVDKKQQR